MTDMEIKELIELRGLQGCKIEDIVEELDKGFCVTDFTLNKPACCNEMENCFKCWYRCVELYLKEKNIIEKKRYRVESKNANGSFRVDCDEDKLEYWKKFCIENRKIAGNNEKCYYRQYPLIKSRKIYF